MVKSSWLITVTTNNSFTEGNETQRVVTVPCSALQYSATPVHADNDVWVASFPFNIITYAFIPSKMQVPSFHQENS